VQESDNFSAPPGDSGDFLMPSMDSEVDSGGQSLEQAPVRPSSSGSVQIPAARSEASGRFPPRMVRDDSQARSPESTRGATSEELSASPGSSAASSSATPSATGSSVTTEPTAADCASTRLSVPTVLVPPVERPRARLQSGVSKPKEYTNGTDRYDRLRFGNFCSTSEPSNLSEALANPSWKSAMDEEYSALMQNQT
jgi:hypothetical protein